MTQDLVLLALPIIWQAFSKQYESTLHHHYK